VVIISGGDSEAVKLRMNKLGVKNVFLKVEDKKQQLDDFLKLHNISLAQVLFMGDDIPDYAVMKKAGLPCCPADAAPEIKQISKYITVRKGGEGCAREVIEKVLKLNDHWEIDTMVSSK
jgi:3-deoxy-D-manno-octulosonate 8-phosphate phosphatase (KDO 8-P phosphatase)